MQCFKPLSILSLIFLLFLSTPAQSQDFPWIDDFNQKAAQDITAFKQKLADRFNSDLTQVEGVFKEMKTASDAYMTYKLGEMSGKPLTEVANKYSKGKAKGWGALAKSLGIKPGSKEFHALKQKEDLFHGKYTGLDDQEDSKEKGKGKGKAKKNKNKKK